MTQIDKALEGKITREIRDVAKQEKVSVGFIVQGLKSGRIIIPVNNSRPANTGLKVCGIGEGLRTKVNANIGTSPDSVSIEREIEKLQAAVEAGADTVMDLSTGGNIRKIRQFIIRNSKIPVGTVPIYQVACETLKKGKSISQMDPGHFFSVIEEQAADGVDFITVHCGVTVKTVRLLKKTRRVCGVVSRGGAFLVEWILSNNRENPLYERFDILLDIARKYDVALSLGDGLRPGAIADADDAAQLGELREMSALVRRARRRNVQVMVEGPGHMPLDKITGHVRLQKKLTGGAPFYVLGPLVCDVAAGYDHITSAIGGAVAASAGVDFLCYVTPAEHIHLPDAEDVRLGVISSRIAAHSGDIAKGVRGAKEWDLKFSGSRKALNWEMQGKLALDPVKFRRERERFKPSDRQVCTMCGSFCAMKEMNKVLRKV
ncbi:MAG: phosphomethylpyrimidine synthase ThiC [Elusimicrobiota bacterium]